MRLWYGFCLATAALFLRLFMRPRITGWENIPRSGGLIIAPNHLSYWDPPLTAVAVQRESYFLAKEELFRIPLLGTLIGSLNSIPVRRGVADLKGISRSLAALKNGGCLILFPEGGRSLDGRLHRARPGVGLMVTQARVPVVPTYIVGTNRGRRWIALREKVRIHFGPPLSPEELIEGTEAERSRDQYQSIGNRVMDAIARIKHEIVGGPSEAAPGPTERGAKK